ncbi:MAG: hypothetical protein VB078_05240 [Clostridiaceae bacterium]|nr:hypothetical protein [Clostridiaceae bacterium]
MKRKSALFLQLSVICAVILGGILLLAACKSDNGKNELWSESELNTCELLVHNVTCPKVYEMRTVVEETFKSNVISLCTKATPFRPIISSDIVLGEQSDAYFTFTNNKIKYTVSFFDAEKQLSLDYIYRDSPMVSIEKAEIDELGQPQSTWKWFCSLPTEDFAMLYEAIQTYTAGEIIQ